MNLFTRSKFRLLVMALSFASVLSAQDIHFDQYYTHASSLNPALVGNYDGSYRLAAIYRNQFGSFLGKDGFQTIGADVDFCLLEGYLRDSKLAIGAGVFSDRAGTAGDSKLNVSLSVAYHFGFGKDGNHRLSVGMQGAFYQRRIDKPVFADQFNGHNQTPSNGSAEVLNSQKPVWDVNAGLYWRSNIKDIAKIGVGFGCFHLYEPKTSTVEFNGGVSNQNPNDFVLFRRYSADLNVEVFVDKKKKFSLTPEMLFHMQGPAKEIQPGMLFSYYFNTGFRMNNSLSLGARYRLGDAVVCLVQGEFRNVRLGFAYDVNVSDLTTSSRNQGAFEISLSYIGETVKSFKANKSLPSRRF